jgi:molybdopterin-guanine dinucleotide biosynthesis adapter protein
LNPKVVSIIGTKKSGKTTTTENLISELTKRGYKVAAIKHVPERENFTVDTPGKDTYRYAQHGAKTIIAISANEIATIEKLPAETVPFEKLIEKCVGNDIVLVEGLKQTVAKRPDIAKIAVVKTQEEAQYALEAYEPIIAFSGPYNTEKLIPTIPYADALKNPEKLADLIEKKVLKN